MSWSPSDSKGYVRRVKLQDACMRAGSSEGHVKVVAIDRQSLAKIKPVGLLSLHAGIEVKLSASVRPGFCLKPIQQAFP